MSSIRDVLLITIVLFATGIAVYFSVNIGHQVNAHLYNVSVINNSAEAVSAVQHADTAINMMDYIYFVSFIALMLGIMITGWFISGVPILAPIYFFILIVFAFVGVVIQNVWGDMTTNAILGSQLGNLPLTNFILTHLGYFSVGIGLLSMIILFGKPGGENMQGGF